jgi:hypothetical protein
MGIGLYQSALLAGAATAFIALKGGGKAFG